MIISLWQVHEPPSSMLSMMEKITVFAKVCDLVAWSKIDPIIRGLTFTSISVGTEPGYINGEMNINYSVGRKPLHCTISV